MKNKLSKAALSASGLILLSTFASGQTVYIEKDTGDSINEGYYDTLGGSGEGSEWEVREEDGTEYLWAKGFHFNRFYADDWVGLADYEIQPTDEEPLIFSYRMYDALDAEEGDDRLTDAYTEVSDLPKVILFAF